MIRSCLLSAGLSLCALISGIQGYADKSAAVPDPQSSSLSAIAIIQSRYTSSVLPATSEQRERLRIMAAKDAASLGPNGKWRDIDYHDHGRAIWKTTEHLDRTLIMAKAARLERETGHPDSELESKTIRALKEWTDADYQNSNWWWNQIGVPELTGEIAILIVPELPHSELRKVVDIMSRSDWRRVPWTGANLIWGVTIEIVRGCLENSPATVAEAYDRMYKEIKVVPPTEEGIQQDDSFHQHGAQLYNGGYGLAYANDVGRFIAYAWGTHFQIPPDRMAIFSSYLLDGEQWMIRGDVMDYSVMGREITRKETIIASQNSISGPISHTGSAYSLLNMISMLAADSVPRQREFKAFAARLKGESDVPELTGNKQFWCSDFMAHRRKGFYTSVKMLSNRMLNGELVNGEGKKSHHLSDGVNFLYLTGDEYRDIFPVWDWTKLPGTTAIQGTLQIGTNNPIGARGNTTFDGGVSDGTYGIAAMDLLRGDLTAKKAWFFFDHGYLCLGADITLSGSSGHDVATDVNQPLLRGNVFVSQSKDPVPGGLHAYRTGRGFWVYHDNVGYVFGANSHILLSLGPQTGRWSDIGSGSNQPVTLPVFNLWIDHGHAPHNSHYQYIVLPGASIKEVAQRAERPVIHVLSNARDIQAAWNSKIKMAMIVFRKSGSLATPVGRVTVDHSCLLMVRRIAAGWRITASNPENSPLLLNISVGDRHLAMNLPVGTFAGASKSAMLPFYRTKEAGLNGN